MNKATKLIIVRHGETESNVTKIIQGAIDTPLTQLGRQQIAQLAQKLANEPIQSCFSSDSPRAVATTQAVMALHKDVPIEYTAELRERRWGIFEGRPDHEYVQALKAIGLTFQEHRPDGGESLADLQTRVKQFLSRVLPQSAGQTVYISTHHSTCKMIIFTLLNTPLAEWIPIKLKNASLNIVEVVDGGTAKLLMLNDVSQSGCSSN